MVIDYHIHLGEHGVSWRFASDGVRGYAAAAAAAGLSEIAITEHLYRFPDVQDALGPWWESDPDPRLRDQIAGYFAVERLGQTLAEYVDVVLDVAADPGDGAATVKLGLEVDLFPGRMDAVVDLLALHPWDVLLGSVHWLGAWGFDQWGAPVVMDEWERRSPDEVWLAYASAVEEMAVSGACDVLAHLDLAKVGGVRPGDAREECDERLVKTAAANGLCAEVNTAGWRQPVEEAYPAPPLLAALRGAGVGITLASDAHSRALVGDRVADAASLARAAGYTEVTVFERRTPRAVALDGREAR